MQIYFVMAQHMSSQNSMHSYSDCQSSILSIVESQIIPGLLNSERIRRPHLSLVSSSHAKPSQQEIEVFIDLCVSESSKDAQFFVDDFLDTGLSTEDIFLELLTPAAQYLGSQWDDDRMDFSQVNLGLVRLHSIANEIRFTSKSDQFSKAKVRRVLIASAPASMHMLGTTIVADFFRKEDWQVVVAISSSANELVQTVSNEWFDVLGLSLSIDQQLTGLADLIDQFKSLSLNPRIVVLLGGPIFAVKKLDANDFGANGICDNAKHAVSLAVSLLPID
jgi:MerR family transcriptional regulator, light-induced transcriptional regulator